MKPWLDGFGSMVDYGQHALWIVGDSKPTSDEFVHWIVEGLAHSLPTLRIRDYFERNQRLFEDSNLLVVGIVENQPISLLASRCHHLNCQKELLHIQVQWIPEDYQRTLMLKRMWRVHFAAIVAGRFGFPDVIALRTCHPSAYLALRCFSKIEDVSIYPETGQAKQDQTMSALAVNVAEALSPHLPFCHQTGVIRGASVPVDFYPKLPASGRVTIDNHFQTRLSTADRMLCMLHISTETAKQRILKAFGVQQSNSCNMV